MGLALERLASEVGVHERTLRRAASSGLIHARRPDSRRLLLSDREEQWVRSHWVLVGRLLAALRTEPNLKLGVLFGSVARGEEVTGASDIDLLVELRQPAPGALEGLRLRLQERLPFQVQLTPLRAAQRNPELLLEILRDGRPLVDRAHLWPALKARAGQAQSEADQARSRLQGEAQAALRYFQELARYP